MPYKRRKKSSGKEVRASVKKEMAMPRMTRSARTATLNLDTTRVREQPWTSLPVAVEKIAPSKRASRTDKAQITVEVADDGHRDFRIENTLTYDNVEVAKHKKGNHVEVTVTDKSKSDRKKYD